LTLDDGAEDLVELLDSDRERFVTFLFGAGRQAGQEADEVVNVALARKDRVLCITPDAEAGRAQSRRRLIVGKVGRGRHFGRCRVLGAFAQTLDRQRLALADVQRLAKRVESDVQAGDGTSRRRVVEELGELGVVGQEEGDGPMGVEPRSFGAKMAHRPLPRGR
jgi:hypothetical protein